MFQTSKKKILILHVPFGAGHVMAAKAIAESFEKKYPEIQTEVIDALDFSFEIFRQILPKTFNLMTAKAPFLYKWVYDYCNNDSRQDLLTITYSAVIKNSGFVKFIKDFNPNFIISTNPLPMQLVSFTKQKNIIDILSANVCTDFGFHAFWHDADVNYYFVATEEIKRALAERGMEQEKVRVTGIPIRPRFFETVDRVKILHELGFSNEFPVFLVVGGGGKITYLNLLMIIKKVRERNQEAQFIVVAGRDKSLEKKLEKSDLKTYPKIKVFGFTDKMADFMSVADLILTKAGGLTIAECFAKGLPIIVNDVIPGQEDDNVEYLVKNGAGFTAKGAKEAAEIAVNLLSIPEKLAEIKENSKKLSKPNAAEDIADFVVSQI